MFTYNHYKETINRYIDAGYNVTNFENTLKKGLLEDSNKLVILRHDIDFTMNSALTMAEHEHSIGVQSTFYLRLHSINYNLFNIESKNIINKILEMGHEIGLHYEPGFAYAIGQDPFELLKAQHETFKMILGKEYIGFSTHEPARADQPDLVEKAKKILNLDYHAYEPRFINDIKYISDSGGRWREGCFSNWINKAKKLQVLTHPLWWYNSVTQENY